MGVEKFLRRAVALLLLVIAVTAVARFTYRRSCDSPNVVLIVLDAAAARYFGSYGNSLTTSPNIDAFVAKATLFERAYSQAPATIMSIGSMMSGKYPPTVFDSKKPFDLKNEVTLPIVLEQAGFRTAAFSQNPWVSPTFGFGHGFQEFHLDRKRSMKEPLEGAAAELSNTRLVQDVVRWIDALGDERFFLYVHLLPPHAPYTPPPPFAGSFDPDYDGPLSGKHGELFSLLSGAAEYDERDLEHLRLIYQENLAFGDAQVGKILQQLERNDLFDNSLIIFTSDHGEAFKEHGHLSHGTTLYNEMLHVPLAIHWPSCFEELPARWEEAIELRRLFATVAAAIGVSGGNPEDSLLPRLRGEVEGSADVVRADVFTPFTRQHLRSVVVWPYKLIVADTGEVELYDLKEDAGESRNLADQSPELVRRLRSELEKKRPEVQLGEKVELREGTREKLRSLGYDVD